MCTNTAYRRCQPSEPRTQIITSCRGPRTARRRLRLRIQVFRYGLDGLVVANLAVMGASVSTNPFNVVWQILWVFYGLTAGAAVGLVTAILVVLPVLDARSAAKVRWCFHTKCLSDVHSKPQQPPPYGRLHASVGKWAISNSLARQHLRQYIGKAMHSCCSVGLSASRTWRTRS